MAELKTKKTTVPVKDFIQAIADETVRSETKTLVKLMEKVSGAKAKMWGPAIIGFGDHLLVYPNGRELDWFRIGFSPRKGKFSIYAMGNVLGEKELLARLGKHKTSKGCLYIKTLEEISLPALEQLLAKSIKNLK